MSAFIERQNQQWPHRVAELQDAAETVQFRCRIAMPMPTSLQLSNDQPEYRGSHGMNVYEDPQGQWSFKQPKPNLAFTVPLEAAAATLQRNMGLEAPESYAINHNGAPAVVSKWYPNSTQAFQKPPRLTELSPEDHMTIQKNHVLDWLIGNHDSHVGNWMRTEDGKLVSIDKGQAGKYFGHDRLDPHFHPNYYAREPIYNQLWRDHAKGLGQMHDPRTGELGDFVKQVQGIPDDHLKEMFRPYAQAAAKSGLLLAPDNDPSRDLGPRTVPANDPEAFLHALVQRKNNLHSDLGAYYDKMSGNPQKIGGRAPHRQGPNPQFRPFTKSIHEQKHWRSLESGDGWEPLEDSQPTGRVVAQRTAAGEAGGDRLYLPGDVADHLGVPRQTLMSWIYNDETPTPTHTSKPHKEMWDNLDVWNKWYNRRKSIEAGPRGYPDGWADEFRNRKEPQHMYTVPEISDQTGMQLGDVYKAIYRPQSTSVKIPGNTHYAIGDDKRGVHFWDSLKPLQHTSSRKVAMDNNLALAEWIQWCADNRKDMDRSSLSEYAAISGMDAESYLDLYMFLANNNGIFREAAASGKRLWLPSHIAQHLDVPIPTMISWLKSQQFPPATHTSTNHALLWDSPETWERWTDKYQSLGRKGRQPGWADEFATDQPLKRLHGISDIAKEMDLPLNTVYHWWTRQNMKSTPPDSTHFVPNVTNGNGYLWEDTQPIHNWYHDYKQTSSTGNNSLYLPNTHKPVTQRENPLCPNCFTQHAGECM